MLTLRLQPQPPLPETPLFIQANVINVAAAKRKRKVDRLLKELKCGDTEPVV